MTMEKRKKPKCIKPDHLRDLSHTLSPITKSKFSRPLLLVMLVGQTSRARCVVAMLRELAKGHKYDMARGLVGTETH